MSSTALEKTYDPRQVEERWYSYWEEKKLFHADPASDKPPYSIVIPPPNVTGVLHIGHALDNTLQDVLCRFKRLTGHEVLWMPGTDHAGIATQNVVERALAEEGLTRHDLGREEFIKRVWLWRKEKGGAIINQLKRLGASCDWDRERFTMDEGLSRAVREVFVRLYEEGLIYQGDYIINWCPRCHTALSDLESEHEEVQGGLYHIRYPLADGSGHLVVATTRPETMLGDTAVAVNPADERYSHLPEDAQVILPLMDRAIPVIRDEYVAMDFGTGALKVTPAHDPNDFLLAQKHDLPAIKVMDDSGNINQLGGAYNGLDRFQARKQVLADLAEQGLLEKQEGHLHSVGHCYRCHTMVEPILSRQWFVKVGPLAAEALAAVQEGRTKLVPEMWVKTYYDWMTNIRDWCISRQIWWGHRIPAWYCGCGEIIVRREDPDQCPACGSKELRQDTDVLDTWFSSGLWPFSTMGWPDDTPELKTFYPTSCLVTGFDILFFWVARMMMMGLKTQGEVPFRDVCIHALIRDEHGQKMSKSKGNVIDPLEIMDEFGTDAFRYTLCAFAAQGRDIRMSKDRIAGYRNFVNKIWNAARFTLMNLEGELAAEGAAPTLADRWIISRVGRTAGAVAGALEEYRFNDAASSLYQFIWHEFCDWYLELVKGPLYDDAHPRRQAATRATLREVLSRVLIMLHPFMPFITEELWQKLPGSAGSVMEADWPHPGEGEVSDTAEADMEMVMSVISGLRNIRGEMGMSPAQPVPVVLTPHDDRVREVLEGHLAAITSLGKAAAIDWAPEGSPPPKAASAALGGVTVFVPLEGLIDFGEEMKRLDKEIAKLEKESISSRKKLANEGFLAKAPAEVVAKEKAKVAEADDRLGRLRANRERIKSFL